MRDGGAAALRIPLRLKLRPYTTFLDSLPAPAKFAAIYVLFPDPWPKRRHHKNRIMQPDFLKRLAERAGKETRLHFRTDYEPYFQDARATLDASREWERVEEAWPFEHETVFQSRADSHYSFSARLRLA